VDAVWYFAYGSNLSVDVFRGRRGIEHRRALPGRLHGWRLVFDKPPIVPIGESYANLVADHAAHAIGVLYEIGQADLAHIDLTEGVPLGNYRWVDVEVALLQPFDGVGTSVEARTLVSDHRDTSLCPSHRYMELVIAGARAHALPPEHIESLRAIPSRPSTPEAIAFRERIEGLMRKPR
jgi:hypothetical protein